MIYSYTSITEWRTCPKLFKARYIEKRVETVVTPEMKRGKLIHKKLAEALERRDEPPEGCKIDEAFWDKLLSMDIRVEERKDDNKYCGILDVYSVVGPQVLIVDWKTGNSRYSDSFQGVIYASFFRDIAKEALFILYYVLTGEVKSFRFNDLLGCYNDVQRVIKEIEDDDVFPPLPGWKCRFCLLKECRYNATK